MDVSLKNLRIIVNAPDFMEPWLDRFYEPEEIVLLVSLEDKWESFESIHSRLYSSRDISRTREAIERSWKRGVLDKKENGFYKAADFHTRYDIWALFEGFKDLPDSIRDQLNQWEFHHYCHTHEQDVSRVRRTGDPDAVSGAPRYLLLDEAMQVLEKAETIYLWPCNCRSMINACRKPFYTCIRFENNRGIGFEISREKAMEIVRDSNAKGLMQSGELGRDSSGKLTGAICNCCSDCCFPHLLSKEKGMEKIWPFSRYVAKYTGDLCNYCGLCSKRCPFDAFQFQKKTKKSSAQLFFQTALCRGCGVCATKCPTGAIEMAKLKA